MKITIEIDDLEQVKAVIALLTSLDIEHINVLDSTTTSPNLSSDEITHGDETEDPTELFGIWKNTPKTIGEIRRDAWKRAWN